MDEVGCQQLYRLFGSEQVGNSLLSFQTEKHGKTRTPQVGINHQSLFARLCEGYREISSNGGLAVAGFRTGNQQAIMDFTADRQGGAKSAESFRLSRVWQGESMDTREP